MTNTKKFKIVNIATTSEDPKSSILIIYTGGTFGMVYNDNGNLVPFNFGLVLDRIPELQNLDLRLTVVSFPDPVDSSNISISHWRDIAKIIQENYELHDGFVVLHGTDTMAYTSSALSFMLKGLNKPIILTGAQIPIGATRSDARENLITALEIASARENGVAVVNEVCVYFNFFLLRGNRAQKIRSSRFAAFESENYPYLAESGVDIVYNYSFLAKHVKNSKLSLWLDMDPHVSILKIFPGVSPEIVEGTLNINGLRGLIIETYGSGNTLNDRWFIDLLKNAISGGLLILNVSQCMGGSVIQGRYETSQKLSEIGVISGGDMTTESALTKMMHLLGTEKSIDIIKKKLGIPLRGEITL